MADADARSPHDAEGARGPRRDLDVAGRVEEFWLAQRDADDGCATAAEQQLKAGKLKAHTAWLRARLGMENDRQRVVTQALTLLNDEAFP